MGRRRGGIRIGAGPRALLCLGCLVCLLHLPGGVARAQEPLDGDPAETEPAPESAPTPTAADEAPEARWPFPGEPPDRDDDAPVVPRKRLYCAGLPDGRSLCTFKEGEVHVVCEADDDGTPTGTPCLRRPDNLVMRVLPMPIRSRRSGPKRTCEDVDPCRAALEEARAALEATRTIEDVTALVGAGPAWCREWEGAWQCGWHAVRRTPGYPLVIRLDPSKITKKVSLDCRFEAEGEEWVRRGCETRVTGRRTPPGG